MLQLDNFAAERQNVNRCFWWYKLVWTFVIWLCVEGISIWQIVCTLSAPAGRGCQTTSPNFAFTGIHHCSAESWGSNKPGSKTLLDKTPTWKSQVTLFQDPVGVNFRPSPLGGRTSCWDFVPYVCFCQHVEERRSLQCLHLLEVFLALPSRMHNEMNRDNETIYLLWDIDMD